jgi:beta-ureidopropionase / N-carbamoyl-L-amino-acid hydrolase
MWAELAPIGRSADTGGYHRPGWSAAEQECREWFVGECASRRLEVQPDGNGNLVAWWGPPGSGAVVSGSHLDSVPEGGAYDGPLGVVSALAAIDRLRERGFEPARPIGVAAFAEEEGSRFGMACLGSRLATGALEPARARALRDRDGRALADVVDTTDLGPSGWLKSVGAFVELHVEQGRGLVDHDAPVAVASGIWPHGRWRFDFAGQADHAGTTAMPDRRDPMLTYAMTALAANKQARLGGTRATFGRVEVTPNATNAIPSHVRAWLDARAPDEPALDALVDVVRRQAGERAGRDETTLSVEAESMSPAVRFDEPLRQRLGTVLAGAPVLATAAGHDAGVLAAAGIPAAMLFVRNPTGISHAPAEHASVADCLAGVEALADVLAELAGTAA